MEEIYCQNCNEPLDAKCRDKYGDYYICLGCGYVKGMLYLGK